MAHDTQVKVTPKTQLIIIQELLEDMEANERKLTPPKETDLEMYIRKMATFDRLRIILYVYRSNDAPKA